jgi:hypothetical protein
MLRKACGASVLKLQVYYVMNIILEITGGRDWEGAIIYS